MATPNTELTPMKRQYNEIKEQNQDCILFFRLGDFYEMFDEDARVAARELDLTLTTRDRGKPKEEQTPMCGVPYHSVDSYIARLVQKGYKVAICEQMQDPATTKGLVERDITRIVTPGTVTESCMLDESKNNYMACLYGENGKYGLAFCDVSTGAFFATVCADAPSAASELGRFSPAEVIRGGKDIFHPVLEDALFQRLSCCVDEGKPGQFDLEEASNLLERHFGTSLAQLGLSGLDAAIIASGTLLQTLLFVQKNDLTHIRRLEYYTTGKFMELVKRDHSLCALADEGAKLFAPIGKIEVFRISEGLFAVGGDVLELLIALDGIERAESDLHTVRGCGSAEIETSHIPDVGEIMLNSAAGTRAAGIVHSLAAVDKSLKEHLHALAVAVKQSLCAVYASAERLTGEFSNFFAIILAVDEI